MLSGEFYDTDVVIRGSRRWVPEDLAVVVVGDDPESCEYAQPSLTSVDLPLERVGYEAAAMMSRLLDNRKIIMIGIALSLGFSYEAFPVFYRSLPGFLANIAGSELLVAIGVAILLNLVFRIGIWRTAVLELAKSVHHQRAARAKPALQNFRSSRRYCTASARWASLICSAPSRSAMVRATRRTLS